MKTIIWEQGYEDLCYRFNWEISYRIIEKGWWETELMKYRLDSRGCAQTGNLNPKFYPKPKLTGKLPAIFVEVNVSGGRRR